MEQAMALQEVHIQEHPAGLQEVQAQEIQVALR